MLREFGPNWYATVMGTAIVANAGALLPVDVPGLRTAAVGVWALSVVLLLAVVATRVAHHVRHPGRARDSLLDPAVAPFYGCPPMALLAVGAGTMLVGRDVLGDHAALVINTVLWTTGTILGLAVAVLVPYLMITRHDLPAGSAATTWLLPVVAPMVSAATGPLLIAHLPAGQLRETLLLGCYAMFGLSLLAVLLILPGIWSKLVHHKIGAAQLTPTLWLVLGPLGQSVTAANQLDDVSPTAAKLGVVYGVPVMGFALLWLAIAAAATIRAMRSGMPFALTWWGFTFPLGTCVTGAIGLAHHTGLAAFTGLSVLLYLLLAVAWLVTASRTLGIVRLNLRPLPRRTRGATG